MRAFIDFIANNFGPFFESGSEIFLWFFNRAIAAGWLIIAVILLRFILKKAPKWINCAMWGICALRLVLPFSLKSVLSLIPSAETVPPETIYENRPQIDSGIPVIDNSINEQISEQYYEGVTVAHGATLSLTSFIALIWILGVLALLIYAVVSFVKLKKSIKGATELEKGIFESGAVSSPFILGIFNPRIYLPINMDKETKQYVLDHERAHLKRADHILKPLGFVILALYWFSPLVWIAYMLFCRDIELACDEKVIKELSDDNRADYAQALLSCAVNKRSFSACPLAFGEVSVKDRVKSALSYKKPMLWVIIAALVCAVAVSLFFLTDPLKEKSLSLSVIGYSSNRSGVSLSLSACDINSQRPFITVKWHNNTDGEFTYGENFSLKRYKNGKWENCAKGDVFFHDIAYILNANSSSEQTYYFDSFDVSKAGKYKFETGSSNEFSIEFVLAETKETVDGFSQLSNGAEIIDINFGGEEGEKLFESLCQNDHMLLQKDHLPVVYIESKKQLSEISDKMAEYFSLEREYNDEIVKYDEAFFEQNDLLMIYVWEGSGSVRHEITGLKKDQNNVLTVTINRRVPEAGTADMAGYAVVVPISKQIAHGCSFDAIITRTNLVASSSSENSSEQASSNQSQNDNSSANLQEETSSSNSSSNNYFSQVSSDYINESDIDPNPDLHSLGPQIKKIELNSKIPYITIQWQNANEKAVRITNKYTLERLENGEWVDVTIKNKDRHTEELILSAPNKDYSMLQKEYYLEDFDISKEATYRLVVEFGCIIYREFTIVDYPRINSIPYETEIYDINGDSMAMKPIFEAASEKRADELVPPIVRIENRNELLSFAEKIKPYCDFDGTAAGDALNFNELLKKCGDSFFKTKTLFLMYDVSESILAVEKQQNGIVNITICRHRINGNYAIPTVEYTFATALIIDKNTTKFVDTFDGSVIYLNIGEFLRFK